MLEFVQSLLTPDALWALGQVIMIDLVLAGDGTGRFAPVECADVPLPDF